MKIYAFNGSGFGNAAFSQFAAILFAILFEAEIIDVTDKSQIQEYYDTFHHIDDAYFLQIIKAKIDKKETIIDTNKDYFLIGYYQHDEIYVKYKKEIIEYIRENPEKKIFASHTTNVYRYRDMIQFYDTDKKYDVVMHIRLGDFIKLAWSTHPQSIVDVIDTINEKENIAFVLQKPVNELEERYIRYIRNHIPDAVFEMNENPLMDYNLMRNAKTLICSCSTFSWIAAFMGRDEQLVYFPNYRSRWNHETFRKPHDRIMYYDFKRATEIELWTFLCTLKMD